MIGIAAAVTVWLAVFCWATWEYQRVFRARLQAATPDLPT